MPFAFLTPEFFNNLILANLAIGILLVIGRFTMDMRRKKPVHEQSEDAASYSHLSDTNPSLSTLNHETEQSNQSHRSEQ